jgi:glycosyltransferase involved in cell wall biosynthesis
LEATPLIQGIVIEVSETTAGSAWRQSVDPYRVVTDRHDVSIVHDYLTQCGGAERVVLTLTRAFPHAPLHTSLYEPGSTFPGFGAVDVRTLPLNAVRPLRRHHRLALPLLASSFSRLRVEDDVVICSSSGWAHGTRVAGRKIVYCHTPARWLYQQARYLRNSPRATRVAARALRGPLVRWDRRAARSADLYLANSTVVAERIEAAYGRVAEVLPPPPAITPAGEMLPFDRIEPGFVLCVSRLLAYKNVDAVVRAFALLPNERLVVAGTGPDGPALAAIAGANVTFAGRVDDSTLRWLYANCAGLVAASYEDFGLTPLEAATFGKPVAALRWGGFLDTVVEGRNGIYFEVPTPAAVVEAVRDVLKTRWDPDTIRAVAERFSERRFIERIQSIVAGGSAT